MNADQHCPNDVGSRDTPAALAVFTALLFVVAVAGCHESTPTSTRSASSPSASAKVTGKTVPAELTGYNHTDKTIGAFYVNGEWGGNITPGSGGGSFVCCVDLPVPWHPGLTAKISWEDHEGKMQQREVAVPEYDPKTLSGFNVHFLRSGEIKVFANRMSLWHPDYPLKGEEAELKPGVPIVLLPRNRNEDAKRLQRLPGRVVSVRGRLRRKRGRPRWRHPRLHRH